MKRSRVGAATRLRMIHAAGVLACCVVVSAAGAAVLIPLSGQRQESRQIARDLLELDRQAREIAAANAGLESRIQSLASGNDARPYPVRKVTEINSRLAELNEMLDQAGLAVDLLQPSNATQAGAVRVVPIQMEVRGSREAVQRVLTELSQHHQDLHIESVSIEYTGPDLVRSRASLRWLAVPGCCVCARDVGPGLHRDADRGRDCVAGETGGDG